MDNLLYKKKELILKLKREGVLRSKSVENALIKVPREEFVLEKYRPYAYDDTPLPTLKNQTISAPHMCVIMCEALQINEGEKILEIGTGSGYHAALCAEITSPTGKSIDGFVVSIEFEPELSWYARNNLEKCGYRDRVFLIVADGSFSLPLRIKFDKVLVTAASPRLLDHLVSSLKENGKMVIPVGNLFYQNLLVITKRYGKIEKISLGGCIFVNLRGKGGFKS